jgi:hypothetical protein
VDEAGLAEARLETGGHISIDFRDESEYAIAPLRRADAYGCRMWYSCRGDAYRIGHAESSDRLAWERQDDDAGIGHTVAANA